MKQYIQGRAYGVAVMLAHVAFADYISILSKSWMPEMLYCKSPSCKTAAKNGRHEPADITSNTAALSGLFFWSSNTVAIATSSSPFWR